MWVGIYIFYARVRYTYIFFVLELCYAYTCIYNMILNVYIYIYVCI